MINRFLEAEKESNLIVLSAIRVISEQDVKHCADLKWLNKQYTECQNAQNTTKVAISVINSILYQKNIVFGITRKNLRDIISSDTNWNNTVGLSNSKYNEVLSFLIRNNFIKQVDYDHESTRYLGLYEVCDVEILGFLSGNREEHLTRAIAFAKLKNEKPAKKASFFNNK